MSIVFYGASSNRYNCIHAEVNAWIQFGKKYKKNKHTRVVEMTVFRITKASTFTMAQPCQNCIDSTKLFLKKYNLKLKRNYIKYTNWDGSMSFVSI